ncbi:unnamed protein product [Rotaria sordida]|uniref:MATH domain-containing protein n=1 Tax=Rotaria sordida TaxID=392033 RepID=A0A814VR90_9BILA|nr:unnamed protein product [Rotaria sordida]CAF1458390.1 unnamed protein product [Rotaria sordida]
MKKGLSTKEPFVCPYCNTIQSKKDALCDRGVERELKIIIIICYACPWNGTYNDYLDHLQELHADLECIDCHEHFFAINSFEEHREEVCVHRSIPCGLPNCMNLIKWYDMKAHYLTDEHQHKLIIIILEYNNPKRYKLQIQNYCEFIKKEFNDIQETIAVTFSVYEILLNNFAHLKIEEQEIKTNFEKNFSKIDELKKYDNENEKALKELSESYNSIQIQIESIKKLREESLIQILDNNSTTTLRFNYPNISSFSFQSVKFRTSQYGHTFSLRACSTIDSQQKYLSIFLTLHNGEYSNLIPYPFLYTIYLTLWDQSNQQKHIEYVLKPNPNSTAFIRPTSEKNDEFGIMKFCSLEYLTDPKSIYVRDGAFFIRVFVDFLNTGQNPFQSKDNDDDDNVAIMSTTKMMTE